LTKAHQPWTPFATLLQDRPEQHLFQLFNTRELDWPTRARELLFSGKIRFQPHFCRIFTSWKAPEWQIYLTGLWKPFSIFNSRFNFCL
jgi:hypothetical protein